MFRREGVDLVCDVTLPMTAAALGTTIELPTLEADVAEEIGFALVAARKREDETGYGLPTRSARLSL